MFRFPSILRITWINSLIAAANRSRWVVAKKSDAVEVIVNDPNSITDPILADFHYLEPGDILVSSCRGSQREVLINNPEKKELAVRTTRDTTLSLRSLPLIYRTDTDPIPMSKAEIVKLPTDAKVFVRDSSGEYLEATLHSVTVGESYLDTLRGVYSCVEVISYKGPNIREVATKIIKKRK